MEIAAFHCQFGKVLFIPFSSGPCMAGLAEIYIKEVECVCVCGCESVARLRLTKGNKFSFFVAL